MATSDNSQWVTEADKKRDTMRMASSTTPDEPVQLTQIRQWEAGDLYPEHETFSFGHGFGTAIVEAFDNAQAAVADCAVIVRQVFEALCEQRGLGCDSAVEPGAPARTYELAERLGVGHLFGLDKRAGVDRD